MAALNASEPSSQSGDVCVRLLLSGFTSATSQLPAEMLSTAVRHGFFFFFFLSAYFRCICVFFFSFQLLLTIHTVRWRVWAAAAFFFLFLLRVGFS